MAKPLSVPGAWASAANFTAGILPAEAAALSGTPVRVNGDVDWHLYGWVPGTTFPSQWFNEELGAAIDWIRWLGEGVSTMTKTAHVVETDSSGIARLWGLRIGDGTATGLNATLKLDIVGDGTQQSVHVSAPATGLEAIDIESASDLEPALRIVSTGDAGSVDIDASGATSPAINVVSTTQSAIVASSTTAHAVSGTATSGSGVYGAANNFGILGEAASAAGSGIRGETHASATSSGEGVWGYALADGVGCRATAVDGNAVVASCTGEEDVIVCLAGGDGAAVRMNPQTAPAVQRAGQLYASDIATGQAALRFCDNSTGLSSPTDRYVHLSSQPYYAAVGFNPGVNSVAQNQTDIVLADAVFTAYDAVAPELIIEASTIIRPNPIGAMPKIAACILELWDDEDSSTITTVTVDVPADGVSRSCWSFAYPYTLPAVGAQSIQLRVQTAAGAGGSIDFIEPTIRIRTASAGVG